MTYTKTNPERILYEGLVKSWREYRLRSVPYTMLYRDRIDWYYL